MRSDIIKEVSQEEQRNQTSTTKFLYAFKRTFNNKIKIASHKIEKNEINLQLTRKHKGPLHEKDSVTIKQKLTKTA